MQHIKCVRVIAARASRVFVLYFIYLLVRHLIAPLCVYTTDDRLRIKFLCIIFHLLMQMRGRPRQQLN